MDGTSPGEAMEDRRDEAAGKRKRDPADEGDQDDPAVDSIMTLMCDDAEWEIMNSEEFNRQHLDDDQSCGDDWDTPEEQAAPIYDDITGRELILDKVREARLDEIRALGQQGVWEVVPRSTSIEKTGRPPIRGRWVDVNKGDDQNTNYRSRYVAREIKSLHGGNSREGTFAAMPPLESLKLLLSKVASRKGRGSPHKLLFIDISKAYLQADVLDPDIFVDLPPEMELPDSCARLRKALYGTREAAKCWEAEYTKCMTELGFRPGRSSPCLFWHAEWGCCAYIHGDDFVVSGDDEHLAKIQNFICDRYPTKVRGVLGPDPNDAKEMVILNRVVHWHEHALALEADPRHVEMILQEMGMEDAKGANCIGEVTHMEDGDDVALDKREAREYRSVAARMNFLAADRLDIQFACKEICRKMSQPTVADWKRIKKVARYLKQHPRMMTHFDFQEPFEDVVVYVDSDYAGCKATRKSTS